MRDKKLQFTDRELETLVFFYEHERDEYLSSTYRKAQFMTITVSLVFSILTYGIVSSDHSLFYLIPLIVWINFNFLANLEVRRELSSKKLKMYEDKLLNLGIISEQIKMGFIEVDEESSKASYSDILFKTNLIILLLISISASYFSILWIIKSFGVLLALIFFVFIIAIHSLMAISYLNVRRLKEEKGNEVFFT